MGNKRSDVETGLYYNVTRYYNPEWGRFLNADDVSYLDPESISGLNLFAYCGNNPVMCLLRTQGNGEVISINVLPLYKIAVSQPLVYVMLMKGYKTFPGNLPSKLPKGEPTTPRRRYNPDGSVYQEREYSPDGKAKVDHDHHDNEEAGFDHDHDWDWSNKKKPRGDARKPNVGKVVGASGFIIIGSGLSMWGGSNYAFNGGRINTGEMLYIK